MSICVRAIFSAILTFVLAQFAPSEGHAAVLDRGSKDVVQSVQYQDEPHAATYEARTCFADRTVDRLTATPLAAARPTIQKIPRAFVHASEPGCLAVGMDVVLRLPSSRAPPAFS